MKHKILYVERKPFESVSIEKAFRQIAARLPNEFETDFQQTPYGNRIHDTIRNLIFFRKRRADLYHITGQIHYIALLFKPENTVMSIMDVRFLYIRPGPRRWLLKKLYLDWPIRKLRFITAISEQTKSEIIRYNGCSADKITVLDLPLVVEIEPEITNIFNCDRPTILQVGTMENKNINNLARAIEGLRCKLRIIGRLSDSQISALDKANVEYESDCDLSEEALRSEYRSADLVTFCSTYEGFGLPIIEAQSMRKPVVTSNISPMVEVSGGAAVLVDPLDIQSIRAGIEKIIGNANLREELIASGIENVKRFAPEKVAAAYGEYYKNILDLV